MSQDQLKRKVGSLAARFIRSVLKPDDILGVGTGSTVNCFIDELATADLQFKGAYSSSDASTALLQDAGIKVLDPNDGDRAAIYVDGADEVDSQGALTKGGGGALAREKIVAAMSEHFLCLVDHTKVVKTLGDFPLPIASLPMARRLVVSEIEKLGGQAVIREGFTTDDGSEILDVHGLTIDDPKALERRLNAIPGVVENGIFALHRPFLVLVARPCCLESKIIGPIPSHFAKAVDELDVCC